MNDQAPAIPKEVRLFERLSMAAIASSALVWPLSNRGTGGTTDTTLGKVEIAIWLAAIAAVAMAVLLASRRRKAWAFWAVAISAVADILLSSTELADRWLVSSLAAIAEVAGLALAFAGIYFGFRKPAQAWFQPHFAGARNE